VAGSFPGDDRIVVHTRPPQPLEQQKSAGGPSEIEAPERR
jgi:hypothetical protein